VRPSGLDWPCPYVVPGMAPVAAVLARTVDHPMGQKLQGLEYLALLTDDAARVLPDDLHEELIEVLVETQNVRIERIVSTGHASPEGFWYDQNQHEWVVVLKGAARLRFEDSTVEMKSGDHLNIPAHGKHRV
jgi:cupin 2 domain-containing protein